MLAIRRSEGLAVDVLPERSSRTVHQLIGWGLVDPALVDAGRVVLTQRGRLMADAVVKEILAR
jgi:oxygen-independent coproporphyrinogen-3 oxidase